MGRRFRSPAAKCWISWDSELQGFRGGLVTIASRVEAIMKALMRVERRLSDVDDDELRIVGAPYSRFRLVQSHLASPLVPWLWAVVLNWQN